MEQSLHLLMMLAAYCNDAQMPSFRCVLSALRRHGLLRGWRPLWKGSAQRNSTHLRDQAVSCLAAICESNSPAVVNTLVKGQGCDGDGGDDCDGEGGDGPALVPLLMKMFRRYEPHLHPRHGQCYDLGSSSGGSGGVRFVGIGSAVDSAGEDDVEGVEGVKDVAGSCFLQLAASAVALTAAHAHQDELAALLNQGIFALLLKLPFLFSPPWQKLPLDGMNVDSDADSDFTGGQDDSNSQAALDCCSAVVLQALTALCSVLFQCDSFGLPEAQDVQVSSMQAGFPAHYYWLHIQHIANHSSQPQIVAKAREVIRFAGDLGCITCLELDAEDSRSLDNPFRNSDSSDGGDDVAPHAGVAEGAVVAAVTASCNNFNDPPM